MKRLGIIDWGIGGVSIYKLIKERLGAVPVTYLSDTGVTPYGKMTRSELVARLNVVISFLKTQNVSHVLIGCNAASTAIPHLDDHGMPVKGVIDSAVETVTELNPKKLGLIGGRRTVVSGVYRNAFARQNIGVKQRIAQPLSGLIESGDVSSDKLHDECRRILAPLKNCSHILLACTHYPAISSVIRQYVSAQTTLVDPAEDLARKVGKWKMSIGDNDVFLTTGDTVTMSQAAKAAFDVDIEKIEYIVI